jgi:hypothetical protein
MIIKIKTPFITIFLTAILLGFVVAGPVSADEPVLPIWSEIFNPDGSLVDAFDANGNPGSNGVPDHKELSGGIEAVFIQDNISDSVATDMTVRTGADALPDETVYNGTVDAPHDIGNAHILATRDASGNLQLYAGVELLSWAGSPNTFVEFEFNQGPVGEVGGVPWSLYGDRVQGDLLVRMNFVGGGLNSVDFKQWDGTSYQVLTSATASQACQPSPGPHAPYVFCAGDNLPVPYQGYEVWDLNGTIIPSIQPNGYAEVGVDVAGLLGASTDFSTIFVRTPNDIAYNNFSSIGYWPTVYSASQGGN